MEMIAMLGGLGAGPYLDNPSPAVRAAKNAILAAKTVDEVMAVKVAIPKMGLSQDEAATLMLIADKQIEDILTPFYKKPGYWLVVAVVAGAAWYHRDKIKRLFSRRSLRGLSGVNEFNAAMNDANEAFREAEKAWSRGKHRDAMEMARLADSYISDAKRESGSDDFRKSLASSLEGRVRDLRHHLDALLRPALRYGKPVPSELQTMSYGGDSIAARRGYRSYR